MNLNELKAGCSGIIQAPAKFNSAIVRLMELGLVPGTRVQVVRSAQSGQLLQLMVRGSRLCISGAEAVLFPVSLEHVVKSC